MKPLLTLLLLAMTSAATAAGQPRGYATVKEALPVFNSPAAAANPSLPKPDSCGQVRELEFIALPGTPLRLVGEFMQGGQQVLEVITDSYHPPPGVRLYVNPAGVSPAASPPPPRPAELPQPKEILKRLRSAVGSPYVWGGNLRDGITLPNGRRAFAGLDCSGLLYEATNGLTPRNTADLVSFGRPVPIAGLRRDQLIKSLKPLDLIVWKGHLVIVLDNEQAIESVLWCGRPGSGGVRITPLRQRLGEIMALRTAVDSWPAGSGKPRLFVVRRWLP